MPSGKTHDKITFVSAVPTALAVWYLTQNPALAAWATGAFLFGGLMFGPDLDTQSTPYTRWGIFRFLWYPYKVALAHRSRWSHGLIFGTLLRVIYFAGTLTILAALILFVASIARHAAPPTVEQIKDFWQLIGAWTRANVGEHAIYSVLVGLWLGAASHTLTDIAGTFVKTGRVDDFL